MTDIDAFYQQLVALRAAERRAALCLSALRRGYADDRGRLRACERGRRSSARAQSPRSASTAVGHPKFSVTIQSRAINPGPATSPSVMTPRATSAPSFSRLALSSLRPLTSAFLNSFVRFRDKLDQLQDVSPFCYSAVIMRSSSSSAEACNASTVGFNASQAAAQAAALAASQAASLAAALAE